MNTRTRTNVKIAILLACLMLTGVILASARSYHVSFLNDSSDECMLIANQKALEVGFSARKILCDIINNDKLITLIVTEEPRYFMDCHQDLNLLRGYTIFGCKIYN